MFRELEKTQNALIEYIEATYHITNEHLLRRRRELLETNGVISQLPYIESTARYDPGKEYQDLDLPEPVKELLTGLASVPIEKGGPVVFNPPYSHQAQALEAIVGNDHKNLIVTTGTGSGKTETFLLPILGRLAREAALNSTSFQQRAVRALLLYPMNALVNDQLGRLRLLLGAPATATWFAAKAGRPAKFGRYTGRTPFPGVVPGPDKTKKLTERFRGMRFYYDLEERANNEKKEPDESKRRQALETIRELKERGKWPAKVDPKNPSSEFGFSTWFGRGPWHDGSGNLKRTVERNVDPELLTRFEIQQSPPDLLVTNYSMLEYMMLRPIERSIFDLSKEYYASNPDEKFLLILDEAHLYRGAQGTEVAMLIRRLRSRLGLSPDRLQVICTSASFEDSEKAKSFAAGLSGTSPESFLTLTGDKTYASPSGAGDDITAEILSAIDMVTIRTGTIEERIRAICDLAELSPDCLQDFHYSIAIPNQQTNRPGDTVTVAGLTTEFSVVTEELNVAVGARAKTTNKYLAVTSLKSGLAVEAVRADARASVVLTADGELEIPRNQDQCSRILFDILRGLEVTGRLVNLTSGATEPLDAETQSNSGPAQEVSALAKRLFPPPVDESVSHRATDMLIELASIAKEKPKESPLLAARVHRFYRGLPGIWACSDPNCSELKEDDRGKSPVGKMFVQPVRTCDCGARVFELYTCRTCGSAYYHAWTLNPNEPSYLWHQDVGEVDEVDEEVKPLHILLEDPAPYLDQADGNAQAFVERYLEPTTGRVRENSSESSRPVWLPPRALESDAGQFSKCPRCQTAGRGSRSEIQDLKTKGDEPFQQLIASQLLEQPPRADVDTPLKGRKALIFSDGRQPASRLAGKLKSSSLRDSIRPLLLDGYRFLRERWEQNRIEVQSLNFAYLALHCGAIQNGVTLSPQLKSNEQAFYGHRQRIEQLVDKECDWESFKDGNDSLVRDTPQSILLSLYEVLLNKQTGVHSLALGLLVPIVSGANARALGDLTAPPEPTSEDEDQRRQLLLSIWLRLMAEKRSIFLPGTPIQWVDSTDGARINLASGKFTSTIRPLVTNTFFRGQFSNTQGVLAPWLNFLTTNLGCCQNAGKFVLDGKYVGLADPSKVSWQRCERCSLSLIHI